MKRVLVFQHVGHEILGTFQPLLRKAGFRIRYANFGRHPELELDVSPYDGLIILGGPMGVYESDRFPHLKREIDYIRQFLKADKPILGICLGAQLIAKALGAKVCLGDEKEIGWYDVRLTDMGKTDPLLSVLEDDKKIFQWHQDIFELPPQAVCLAASKAVANQAFRYGEKTYGFQFHLEVDEAMIERWLNLPAHQELLGSFQDGNRITKIREETHQLIAISLSLSQKVFSKYIELFSTKTRHGRLGSGHK